jgi:hypothetical protein
MNEMNNSPTCERASDLIAFVYNEANESEKLDFEVHLKECAVCREEVDSFGLVRESITAWRDEALSGFVSTPLVATTRKKSAIAAFRQFFDLSPLWLKAGAAFALVTFCLLAALAINSGTRESTAERSAVPNSGTSATTSDPASNRTEGGSPGSIAAKYTQDDVDRLIKQALAKHEPSKPKQKLTTPSAVAKSRRPLTRAEREQLAADLRLLSTDDSLNLLGDRINQ